MITYVTVPKTPERELTWLQRVVTLGKTPKPPEPIRAKTVVGLCWLSGAWQQSKRAMSALGHKRTFRNVRPMSPKADIGYALFKVTS